MRNIIIFCNEDIIANTTLNYLLPSLLERGFKAHIFLSQKVSRRDESKSEILSKFNFFTKEYTSKIVYPWIEENIDYQNGYLMTFNQLAVKYECSLSRIQSTKKIADKNKIVEVYQKKQPYITLSVRNNLIISSEVIEIAEKYGCGKIFNIHSSKLPESAGVWCALWDMAKGQSLYGTLHMVDRGIDTGKIIETYSIPSNENYSYLKNLCSIYNKGACSFLELLDRLATNKYEILAQKQDDSKRIYYNTPNDEEIKQIEKLGIKVFSTSEYYELLTHYLPGENSIFSPQKSYPQQFIDKKYESHTSVRAK